MIGILVVTHEHLGEHLIRCACHVVSEKPKQLMHLGVFIEDDPDTVQNVMSEKIQQLDSGDGVLILCDIFGATPCNIATRLTAKGQVACIAGVNLPMLIKALTYRTEATLSAIIEKALTGGQKGMIIISETTGHAA